MNISGQIPKRFTNYKHKIYSTLFVTLFVSKGVKNKNNMPFLSINWAMIKNILFNIGEGFVQVNVLVYCWRGSNLTEEI